MDTQQKKYYTLITGASKGIGKAFAFECANRKMNVFLVARSEQLLMSIKDDLIKTYSVEVEYLAVDLIQSDACNRIFQYAEEKNMSVNVLINNAGSGNYGNFEEANINKNLDVLKLNIETNLKLTHLYLKHYDRSRKSYLLNVISTAAFQPIPNFAVYAASKAFLLSFTKSLRFEQKQNNLVITAFCPGGADSEFFADANMNHVAELNKRWLMDPSRVAILGLNGLMSNKKLVVPGFYNKLHVFLSKIIPEQIILFFTAKIYK